MYYNTPNIDKHVDFLLSYRKSIIAFYTILAIFLATLYTPHFLSSDELFWLKDSKELHKTNAQNYTTYKLSKLSVYIDDFNSDSLERLKKIHKDLSHLEGVIKVSSIFSADYIQTRQEDASEMLVVVNQSNLDAIKIKKLFGDARNGYCSVVDKEFKEFTFFISAMQALNMDKLNIEEKYDYASVEPEIGMETIALYSSLFIALIFVIFRFLFRNYISAFAAIMIISMTTIATFSLIIALTGIQTIHIAMPFIAISISLVEFLYFYYRWHILQHKKNVAKILAKMLNRSMIPALWTSIITALGLGSLVFIDSDIIKLLSLSVILSSVLGYILNLTLLPAFLSFFHLAHTHMSYTKLEYLLASNELGYNKKYLFAFLGTTYLLLAFGIYSLYSKSSVLFDLPVKNEQIELKIPYNQINIELIESLQKFTNDLEEKFEDDLGEIVSLAKIVKSLNDANSQTHELDEEALLQALFYLDLYNLSDKYFDDSSILFQINVFDLNKLELLNWLMNYKGIELYFVDRDSLLSISKYNQTLLLAASLFSALLLIGLITGWIFRSKAMVFVGLSVNLIPLVWFGVFVALFDIALSLEMIIAMTISLGLASDATIHFAFKYFRVRYFGRSKKHALEKLFFYAGIPVITGSLVLILMFASLYFSHIQTLELIGAYSAVLIFISLLTDFFILPVMLLFIDENRFEHSF